MPAPSPPDDAIGRDGPAMPSPPPSSRTLAPSPDTVGIGPRAARGEPLSEARQHLASDPRHIRLAMYLAWQTTSETPWMADEAESHALLLLTHAARLYPEDAAARFTTYLYRYLPRQLRRHLARWRIHPQSADVLVRHGVGCLWEDRSELNNLQLIQDTRTPSAEFVAEMGGLSCPRVAGTGLREARKRAGLTVVQLAERLGVSYPRIVEYENGRRRPTYETLAALAGHLGCRMGEIDARFSAMRDMVCGGAA
jgi:DNA-binding XRE family transcriptional regulator